MEYAFETTQTTLVNTFLSSKNMFRRAIFIQDLSVTKKKRNAINC